MVFKDCNGQYRRSRLGKINKKQAAIIVAHVEAIVSSQVTNTAIPRATADWVSDLGDDLHKQFVSVGLADPRKADSSTTLRTLSTLLLESQEGNAARSIDIVRNACDKVCDFFGAETSVTAVSPTDAGNFITYLQLEKGYAKATVAGVTKKTKQLFNHAIKLGIISESPFADIKAGSMATERRAYVSADAIEGVLAVCDCPQMRLIIALARYAGLRCPSEITNLLSEDVDMTAFKMRIREGKTAERVMPILPELRPHLLAVLDPSRKRVISRYSPTNSNLRKPLLNLISKAGLDPWPRIFHSLRASFQTDLINSEYPAHQVCKWLGNSEAVMQKHYLRETDAVFEKAVETGLGNMLGKNITTPSENKPKQAQEKAAFPMLLGETGPIEYTRRDSNP